MAVVATCLIIMMMPLPFVEVLPPRKALGEAVLFGTEIRLHDRQQSRCQECKLQDQDVKPRSQGTAKSHKKPEREGTSEGVEARN